MKIVQIPLLRDNYGYLVVCQKTNTAGIVDPSEAEPVLPRVELEKVTLTAILNTHHHRDHTGGNEGLLAKQSLEVYGHKSDQGRIPGLSRGVDEGDEIVIGEVRGSVLFIPGHTTGHVAYLFGNNLFCGDTLFTAGCGRLFEGTRTDARSLKKLAASRRYKSLLRSRIHGKQPSFRHDAGTQESQTCFPVRKSTRVKNSRCLHGSFDDGRGKANESVPPLG
jgi:hydroxyacylglutathione hydrolase